MTSAIMSTIYGHTAPERVVRFIKATEPYCKNICMSYTLDKVQTFIADEISWYLYADVYSKQTAKYRYIKKKMGRFIPKWDDSLLIVPIIWARWHR